MGFGRRGFTPRPCCGLASAPTGDYMLSSLYTTWMDQLLAGPIPPETKATCDNCAMLPQSGTQATGVFFHPVTRCCTFQPTLANYRAGLILSDDEPDLAAERCNTWLRDGRR